MSTSRSSQQLSEHTPDALDHPLTRKTFRRIKQLVGGYVGIAMLTLAAIVLLRTDSGAVNSAVWTRAIIVVLSSLLTLRFTVRAAGGSRRSYLRLRIVSAVMVVAIVVIVALPGTFPVWMKIDQSVCGLVLIGIVVLVNGTHLRSVFADPARVTRSRT